MSIWNEELEQNLIKLWNQGVTTAEIGRILGVTKNSVIGKSHRLNLQKRESCIKYKEEIESTDKEIISENESIKDTKVEKVSSKSTVTPSKEIKKEKLITLMDLEPGMCHWPVGDPKDEDFHFCGCKTHHGRVYCDYHHSIAYVQIKK